MPKYTFLAFTNPIPGADEAAFNAWYDEHHVPDVLNVPGFVSARRFRIAHAQYPLNAHTPTHRYLALYEIETDDLAGAMNEIVARAGTADMMMIETMDMSTLNSPVYEEIVPAVYARDVQRPRRA